MEAEAELDEEEEEHQQRHPNKDLEDMKKKKKKLGHLAKCRLRLRKRRVLFKAAKEEVDARSIYVGNVDYACTALEVQQHFKACGTVNRVTILTNQFGQPKGCAYVEFLETDSIHNALLLNESVLHGRRLKVSAKRTNLPGINQYQGRRPFGIRYRRPSLHPPPGFGLVPRYGRPPTRFRPY